MASPSLAKGANLQVATTAVRVELTPTGTAGSHGSTAQAGPTGEVRAFLLTGEGRAVQAPGTRRAGVVEVDLRTVPRNIERVLFCVSGVAPGLLLRLLDTADAARTDTGGDPRAGGDGYAGAAAERAEDTELARFEMVGAPGTSLVGGELSRDGGRWSFRALGQACADFCAACRSAVETAAPSAPRAAPEAPPAPRVPAQGTAPADESGEAALPPVMRRRLRLRGEQVVGTLGKHGATGARARVILVLDASAAMSALYSRGVVADLVERAVAVAARLDEECLLRAWTFASAPARLPDVTLGVLPEWLGMHVRAGELSLLGRPRKRRRGLHPDQVDMRLVGIQNEEHKVIAEVRAYVRAHPAALPTLVVFLTAGGIHRNAEIEQQLTESLEEPVFWQFVGLGRAEYGVLARLGALRAGPVDNAGFFAVDDVARTPDAELYDRLLSEFPSWLARARRAGILGG